MIDLRNTAFVTSLAAAVSPTQALVDSFAGTGLLDALLMFDPAHHSAPGNSPGHLVDALGNPITYDALNTQATPSVVQDASGYSYASADGIDDTLIASAPQTVAWYCAVFRTPPGHATWNSYGGPLDATGPPFLGPANAGGTGFVTNSDQPRGVRGNGVDLASPWSVAPLTNWQVMTVHAGSPAASRTLSIASVDSYLYCCLHLAALAIRYTDPTSVQQTQIESRLAPMQQALFAIA